MSGTFNFAALGIFSVVAIIFAIAATVLAFIFIVPEKKREKLGTFGKFVHDTVNFKYLIVEKILQALYIFATAYSILCGFFMLFMTTTTWTGTHWLGGWGILLMLLGPIVIRLSYELLMMAVLLVKNVIEINGKLRAQDGAKANDVFAAPDMSGLREKLQKKFAKEEPEKPTFCAKCGTKLDEGGACPNCTAQSNEQK